ncbi:MAG: cupin domain-containing protein [Rhodospirillaceae bacterium]|nr:cupin domain-containing protein [Rhodospirillaceae bacterium]
MIEQFDTDRRELLQRTLARSFALLGAAMSVKASDAEAAAASIPETVRRVVSANNAEGKSCIYKDEVIKRDQMWSTNAGEIFGPMKDGDKATPLPPIVAKNLPDGGTQAFFFSIPPTKEKFDRATIKGWHRDESIAYSYLVSGEVTWVLEADEVHVKAGDVLVQRNANHTWHNAGNVPAVGFAVKIRVA